MIAEIHNKISRRGTNLSDKLEDKLTGDFFGAMRLIPFKEGLKKIFINTIYPESLANYFDGIDTEDWSKNIEFWKRHRKGEIDVYIEFDNISIGIEVKYLSPLSSFDEAGVSDDCDEIETFKESRHQLIREAHMLEDWAKGRKKILLFIADEAYGRLVFDETAVRKDFKKHDVILGLVSWQKIFAELCKLKFSENYKNTIVNDLTALLKRKDFDVFREFSCEKIIKQKSFWEFDKLNKEYFSFDQTASIQKGEHYDF